MVIALLVVLVLFCVFSCVLVDTQSPGFTFSFETENGIKRAFVYGSPNFHGVYIYNTNDGTRRVVHFGGSERDSGPFVQLGGPATSQPVGPPTPWYPATPAPARAPQYAPASTPRPIYTPAPSYAPGTTYAPAPGPAPAPSPAGPPLPVAQPASHGAGHGAGYGAGHRAYGAGHRAYGAGHRAYGAHGGGYAEGEGAGGGGADSQSIAPGLIASATGGGLG